MVKRIHLTAPSDDGIPMSDLSAGIIAVCTVIDKPWLHGRGQIEVRGLRDMIGRLSYRPGVKEGYIK